VQETFYNTYTEKQMLKNSLTTVV